MENNRYPKQCYYMLFQLDEAGRKNWVSHVKEILYTFGFGQVRLLYDIGNDKEFIKLFKKRIIDCHKQKWYRHTIIQTDRHVDRPAYSQTDIHVHASKRFRPVYRQFQILNWWPT